MTTIYTLSQLGWSPFFQQQLSLDECETCVPARVVSQHRSYLVLYTERGKQELPLLASMPILAVGDWVLLTDDGAFHRQLDRLSIFSRKAPGRKVSEQLIASNINTVFIVVALNQNFSLNRIERYLVLTKDAGAEAVIVLTKSDLCDEPSSYVNQVQALDPMLMVEALDARDARCSEVLEPWCRAGNTVAVLGSSGVGKSTLVNTLLGEVTQATASAREADDKGRHTTTTRTLHLMKTGGILLDTPGMRELQLADCESGIDETFSEISELASQCRYSDCQHQSEPGCAVQEAIRASRFDERRLRSYLKLKREQAHNGASLAEKRAKDRSFSRHVRSVMNDVMQRKKG